MKLKFIFLFILTVSIFTSCSKQELEPTFEEEKFALSEEGESISSAEHTPLEAELFNLVNEHRVSIGLNALSFEPVTYYYSGQHNEYMISKNGISHDNFSQRAKGISDKTGAARVAENVARNFKDMESVLRGWIDSESHRNSLEGNFTHSAISIKENKNGKLYFTQMFYK